MPPFALIDAFTGVPFAGNPAGVVVSPGPVDDAWAQALAAEVRASETAFVHRDGDGEGWQLRWFTPTAEVDLCGHATLATAHVLWASGEADGPLTFSTRSGRLTATRDDGGLIWLDLPSWPVRPHPEPVALTAALAGAPGRYLGRTAGRQPNDVVELPDVAAVHALAPDLDAVEALGSTGLIVTAAGRGDVDVVSRYFAPAVGVDEDPVTGSAHSTLGPLWAARLGRGELLARQLSTRGGELRLRLVGDRVHVGGHAVTVIDGVVHAPAR